MPTASSKARCPRCAAPPTACRCSWADGQTAVHRRPLPLPAGAGRDGCLAAGRRHAPAALRSAGRHPAHACDGVAGTSFAVWAPNAVARQRGRRLQRLGRPPPPDAPAPRMRRVGDLPARRGAWARATSSRSAARDGQVLPLQGRPLRAAGRAAPGHGQRRRRHAAARAALATQRQRANALDAPISIYEVHLGSWRRKAEDGQPLAELGRAGRHAGALRARHGLHPPRAAAGQRASVRRLLGLPADRPVRADLALRRRRRASRRFVDALPCRRASACCSTGCRRTSRPTRTAWRNFDGTPPVRIRRPARRLPPGLEHADLQLRPHRGAQLPGRQRAVLAGALRRRRPARRCGGLDALPRLQPQARRMGAQRARRAREPGSHRLPASA